MVDANPTVTIDGGDEPTAATVIARPDLGAASASTDQPSAANAGWSAPVARALHGEEVARARRWSVSVLVLVIAALSWLPFLPGRTGDKLAFAIAAALIGLTAALTWQRTRDEAGYTPTIFRVFGYTAATGSWVLVYYLGVFSPTPLVITLGVTFFGMGMDRRHALIIPLYAIAGYLVLAGLIAVGVLEDHGVIDSSASTVTGRVFFVGMAPLVLLTTLWMARVSRRTMADAMAKATIASRLAAQREALLVEAQQDLEQLLRAGAGVSGRYTGSTAGTFEVEQIIGRGAMGEVYAAHDDSGQRAAIKFLRPEMLIKEKALERFLREGKAAGALASPHVVKVLDVGELDTGRIPYIAMELLRGEDLAAILRKRRRLPADEVLELVRHTASGLAVAHDAGIVHRDLKPQNLFRHRDDPQAQGTWKILDFGVSKLADSGGTLTQRAVVGTPGYMAPEQARGNEIDRRCDVFALGAVTYRAVTGRPAFSGPDMPRTLFAIVYEQPPKPSSLVDDLPRDLDRCLALALAKDPDQRLGSARELADALEQAFAGKLDHALRARADALITQHPWGARGDSHTQPG